MHVSVNQEHDDSLLSVATAPDFLHYDDALCERDSSRHFSGDAYSPARYSAQIELDQALLIRQRGRGRLSCARLTLSQPVNMADTVLPATILNITVGPLLVGVGISTM